ncbi:MAG: hypothetical protein RLZZ182_2189 [Pseudomonadota bacterium]
MSTQALGPAPRWLMGVDFSCAPDARKPITVAWGERRGAVLRLERLDALPSLDDFAALLTPTHERAAAGWLGGFDFPFGLPRVFVDALVAHGLPEAAPKAGQPACDALVRALHAHCTDRQGFQALIDGWGTQWGAGTRPDKLPHRAADLAMPGTQSTSPLQTRYVPVGKMYFEGLHRLVMADVALPGLRQPDGDHGAEALGTRLAFEAYPGLLATEVLGKRSYKSDDKARQDPDRLMARLTLIDALEQGRTRLGLRLKLSPAQRDHLASDAKGDRLDAVLCLLQAGWADLQREAGDPRCGLPPGMDPVEGWILTA